MLFGVINDKGEHAPQAGEQRFPPFLKAVHQHLAVSLGGKGMPCFEQLLPQRAVVVDLTVEHQHQRLVLIIKRLVPRLEVDDAEPPKAHCHRVVDIVPIGIRSAMGDPLRHIADHLIPVDNLTCKPAESTHIQHPPCAVHTHIVYRKRKIMSISHERNSSRLSLPFGVCSKLH